MKVLHIINSLDSGGAQKLVEDIALLLNRIECMEVKVLLLSDENNVFDKKLIKEGIGVSVIPLKKLRNPLNIFHIRKYLKQENFDIVHAHLFPANYWLSITSKLLFSNKPKLVITEHSTHNRRRNQWYFKPIDKYIYSSYDKIISISDKTEENLIGWLNDKKTQKYKVIENGIYVDKFINATPYKKSDIDSGINETNKLLCMVGRFSIQKDQKTIIKAMKNLHADVHLLLIGEGELKSSSEDLANEIGVSDRVHFLGFRDDIAKILKTVDLVILSSHWEGFGLAAVEGMAAAKPVIGSNVSGLSEIIERAGVLFENENVQDLSEKIKNLLQNVDDYQAISTNCFNRAKNFDINKMVMDYIQIYKMVHHKE